MLELLKQHRRGSYEDVVRRLVYQKRSVSSEMLNGAVFFPKKRGVKDISVFGAPSRGDSRPGSDLDLLVDFFRPEQVLTMSNGNGTVEASQSRG